MGAIMGGSMINTFGSIRASFSWSFLLALFMLPISGCGDTTMKWKEQVDLHNNETIIVARTATMAGNWIAGGGGGSINKRMTVKIIEPARRITQAYGPTTMFRSCWTGTRITASGSLSQPSITASSGTT
ncbi:hypothetical protein AWV80_06505 [Cupriavidus sp. UYMU48A]|nr:hypothetical protein AWV80_06505 [Cupriavidus sp. UYMU48A]